MLITAIVCVLRINISKCQQCYINVQCAYIIFSNVFLRSIAFMLVCIKHPFFLWDECLKGTGCYCRNQDLDQTGVFAKLRA